MTTLVYFEPGGAILNRNKIKNTIMPWSFLAQMTEEDLGAIFDYLQTVKPVENEVETWPAKE